MNLAIKLPGDLRRRVCSFPFLQALVKGLRSQIEASNKELPEEEQDVLKVHLIAEKEHLDTLNLLPFSAFYHELEKEDLKSVFTIHRAVKNFKIDKVDAFLSLSESFVDASIGKTLGAKLRAGFAIGKNAFFFNQKVPLLKGRHYTEQYHEFLKVFLETAPEHPAKGFSRELDSLVGNWQEEPYYLVNLSVGQEGEIEEFWSELFSLAQNQRFYFVCDSLPLNRQRETIQEFIHKLGSNNTYCALELESLIDFSKYASYAQSFITMDSALMQLAAYCGGHVHFLRKKETMQTSGPIYFLGEVRYFNLSEPVYREGSSFAYHKVFDEILEFMDLKDKEREK